MTTSDSSFQQSSAQESRLVSVPNPMTRIFIVGVGRSGTSLLAGLFRRCGLYMGESFYRPRDANPHGFFEDREVNSINEEILRPYLSPQSDAPTRQECNIQLGEGQRWLAHISPSTPIAALPSLGERISKVYSHGPSCLKDPRFCYTLGAWSALLRESEVNNMTILCIFRYPSIVATSIRNEIKSAPYLATLSMDYPSILQHWKLAYTYLLRNFIHLGKWLFVPYESLFTAAGLERIEFFTGLQVDHELPSTMLNRTTTDIEADQDCLDIYQQLLFLSSDRVNTYA